jgi:regulator of sigma E protease
MAPRLRGETIIVKVQRAGRLEELEVGPVGFDFGDRIVGTTDPDHPNDPFRVKLLRPDPMRGEHGAGFKDAFEFRERMARLADKPVVIQVRREMASEDDLVSLLVPPAYQLTWGARMTMGKIAGVRENSRAAKAGVIPDDVIKEVSVLSDKDVFYTSLADLWLTGIQHSGSTPWSLVLHLAHLSKVAPERLPDEDLDPVRLPWALTQRIAGRPFPSRCLVRLGVVGTVNHDAQGTKQLEIAWDPSWSLEEEAPLNMSSPLSIPQLGIAYWVESTVAAVAPDSPADKAGLKVGDQLTQIRIQNEGKKGSKPSWGDWYEMKSVRDKGKEVYDQWAHFHWNLQQWVFTTIEVKVKRSGSASEIQIGPMTAVPDLTWPRVDRGMFLQADTRKQQAANTLEAITFGIDRTVGFIQQIYLSLTRLATARLSYKNLGGPIRIAEQTFNAADADFAAFILLLGLISVNLAVVNFLPIPVLDGGHMVFLIYEKLRGKPPPEMIRAVATYAGLATILLLMVFVFWIDISHFWGAIRRSVGL